MNEIKDLDSTTHVPYITEHLYIHSTLQHSTLQHNTEKVKYRNSKIQKQKNIKQ
jgi:hypothetical protein